MTMVRAIRDEKEEAADDETRDRSELVVAVIDGWRRWELQNDGTTDDRRVCTRHISHRTSGRATRRAAVRHARRDPCNGDFFKAPDADERWTLHTLLRKLAGAADLSPVERASKRISLGTARPRRGNGRPDPADMHKLDASSSARAAFAVRTDWRSSANPDQQEDHGRPNDRARVAESAARAPTATGSQTPRQSSGRS